jgi:hypothetical protein
MLGEECELFRERATYKLNLMIAKVTSATALAVLVVRETDGLWKKDMPHYCCCNGYLPHFVALYLLVRCHDTSLFYRLYPFGEI